MAKSSQLKRRAKKVVRLLTFNKQEWKALLSTMRIFITILFLFLLLFFVWIR